MKALAIRQPWAWLIVNGYKTVENRRRSLGQHTGPLLIHASSRMTFKDYEDAWKFLVHQPALNRALQDLPVFSSPKFELVGMVDAIKKIDTWDYLCGEFEYAPIETSWYMGEVGYVLRNAKPLPFKVCKGRLGFFDVDYEALPA